MIGALAMLAAVLGLAIAAALAVALVAAHLKRKGTGR